MTRPIRLPRRYSVTLSPIALLAVLAGVVLPAFLLGCDPGTSNSADTSRMLQAQAEMLDQIKALNRDVADLRDTDGTAADASPDGATARLLEVQENLLAFLQAQAANNPTNSAEWQTFSRQVSALESRLTAMEALLQAQGSDTATVAALEAQIRRLEGSQAELEQEIEQRDAQIAGLQEAVANNTGASPLTAEQWQQLQDRVNELDGEVQAAQREREQTEETLEAMREQLQAQTELRQRYERILARNDLLPRPADEEPDTPETVEGPVQPQTAPAGQEPEETPPAETGPLSPPQGLEDVVMGTVVGMTVDTQALDSWHALVAFPIGTRLEHGLQLNVFNAQGEIVGRFIVDEPRTTPSDWAGRVVWYGGSIRQAGPGDHYRPREGYQVTTLVRLGSN